MRTLYVRIIVITMIIVVAGALLAFVASNVYYQYYLKSENDEKVTEIAKKTADVFEEHRDQSIQSYLSDMAEFGHQYYLIAPDGTETSYGGSFRTEHIDETDVQKVLDGEIYHGIRNFPWKLFITGFYDNELVNTIGVPVHVDDDVYALFVRQDTSKQFGEMRVFLAVLLILTLLICFLFVVTSTRFIVKPIKSLTTATRKIANGNYHIKLRTNRRDEFGRLAHDFQKMSDNLALNEEKRQEFVSNVSHEIQSPLTSIQGFSQALREDNLTKEEREHYLSIIEKESVRLSSLSKQLLTLSFLDNDKNQDKRIKFNVKNQLKEVISTTEWQWRNKDLTVEMDLEDAYIVGDSKLLQQVWMNLMTNAIRYTDQGGTIEVRLKKHNHEIEVCVADTGIGIDEQHIAQLFERFYKVDKARTRTDKSTGLGLSIVKRIVALHDGTVTVESTLGKGSTFCVTLPLD
ncbi:MAG TPA: HAMP domain-containing sensor histidine kinase [Virgibacillus sp.]|nr:HAMP domain-containing sensor histidine kinase [Virgibacillus sp.]